MLSALLFANAVNCKKYVAAHEETVKTNCTVELVKPDPKKCPLCKLCFNVEFNDGMTMGMDQIWLARRGKNGYLGSFEKNRTINAVAFGDQYSSYSVCICM